MPCQDLSLPTDWVDGVKCQQIERHSKDDSQRLNEILAWLNRGPPNPKTKASEHIPTRQLTTLNKNRRLSHQSTISRRASVASTISMKMLQ